MYPSPPASPTSRRRRTSSVASSGQATPLYSPGRRDSQYSAGSRRSSRVYSGDGALKNQSSTSINGYFGSSVLGNGGSNEQENLADELAGAMDEDDVVDESNEDLEISQLDGTANQPLSPMASPIKVDTERTRDSGIAVDSSPGGKASDQTSTALVGQPPHAKHSRTKSRTHSRKQSRVEGSELKIDTKAIEEIPPSLQTRITEIETLARQGSNRDNTIEEVEDSVGHFVLSLKDLGGQQASLESYATRLITAHTSLSMHLSHQSKMLQSLAYYLLAPSSLPPFSWDAEDESDLIPLLVSAIEAIPKPTYEALAGLHRLYTTSADLNSCLSSLSDSLHMSRQITSTATRRLKGAKELVAELRRELQANEEAVKSIEDGQWDRKLARRECASVCRDVVGGFEEVCNGWRSKLEQGAVAELGVA